MTLRLCTRIAHAYADLHAVGVLHRQVHPRHVLVDANGSVSLLDFSCAAMLSLSDTVAQPLRFLRAGPRPP
jgi:DNA-binding helix-hairpin-helix protein with protein kinase domain